MLNPDIEGLPLGRGGSKFQRSRLSRTVSDATV